MYKIIVSNSGTEYILHSSDDISGELNVLNPVLTLETGKSGELAFTVPPTNPNRDKIKTLTSDIIVYRNSEALFYGRAVGDEEDFYNRGAVTCEGELSFLCDSIQRPYEFSGNAGPFIEACLKVHNSQVESRKQFKLGRVTVPDTSGDTDRSNDTAESTMDVLKTKLTDISGGNLRVRHESGVKYLDYLSTYGDENVQVIRFADNLIDFKKTNDPTKMFTALIPYGAEDEDGNRVTIKSVNNNIDYLVDQNAVKEYGYIWASETFEDVTEPKQLLKKAKAYLAESTAIETTLEVKAIDLNLLDDDIASLKLGCYTTIYSGPHSLDTKMLLNKMVLHLDDPSQDTITFGKTIQTFTGSTNDNQYNVGLKVEAISGNLKKEIDRKIDNATQLITGGQGGYLYTHMSTDGHPDELVIMDTPDIKTAKKILRINKNGIGFSQTGYNGVFKNAWTIDGNLIADFISAGTMLADRIRGGTFEVGGTGLGKAGEIIIRDENNNQIGVLNKNGITINNGVFTGKVTANSGQIGMFTINSKGLSASSEDATIDWGNFYIDGNDAYIGGWEFLSTDSGDAELRGPLLTSGDQAQHWDQDGVLHATDLYLYDSWWTSGGKHWSVTETVETLWNYVYNGGWKPCSSDKHCTDPDFCADCTNGDTCGCETQYCICDGNNAGDVPCVEEIGCDCETHDSCNSECSGNCSWDCGRDGCSSGDCTNEICSNDCDDTACGPADGGCNSRDTCPDCGGDCGGHTVCAKGG